MRVLDRAPRRPGAVAGRQDMGAMRRRLGWLLGPWNVTGQPAISVPAGSSSDGLPIGVQLVAAWGREDLLVQAACLVEQARPWPLVAPTPRPGVVR